MSRDSGKKRTAAERKLAARIWSVFSVDESLIDDQIVVKKKERRSKTQRRCVI